MITFTKAVLQSSGYSEHNDCAVKAVAIACDVPYSIAHAVLKKNGRKARRGTIRSITFKSVEELGFKLKEVVHTAKTIDRLTTDASVQQGFYFAFVSGHILTVVNGKVEDWTGRGSLRRVLRVFQVTPATTRKERAERIKQIMKG